jgi:hypothetical protein
MWPTRLLKCKVASRRSRDEPTRTTLGNTIYRARLNIFSFYFVDSCGVGSRQGYEMPSRYAGTRSSSSRNLEAHHRDAPTCLTTSHLHTMQSLRRTAVTAARKGRTTLPRQPRRFAHDEHAHGHGHAPVDEPMGVCHAPFPLHTPAPECWRWLLWV